MVTTRKKPTYMDHHGWTRRRSGRQRRRWKALCTVALAQLGMCEAKGADEEKTGRKDLPHWREPCLAPGPASCISCT